MFQRRTNIAGQDARRRVRECDAEDQRQRVQAKHEIRGSLVDAGEVAEVWREELAGQRLDKALGCRILHAHREFCRRCHTRTDEGKEEEKGSESEQIRRQQHVFSLGAEGIWHESVLRTVQNSTAVKSYLQKDGLGAVSRSVQIN